jgi:hypothetical protein
MRYGVVEPGIAPIDAHRGLHGSGARQRRTRMERKRIAVLGILVIALIASIVAALAPVRHGRSRLLPPVPAVVSQRPIAPVPTDPTASPAEPPGFPTAIPTGTSPAPADPPATGPAGGDGGANRPVTPPTHPPIRAFSVEAESAANTLSGATRIRSVAEASGGQAIGFLGGGTANTLRFNNVVVPAAGTYTLTVFYLSGEERSARIDLNADRTGVVTFASGGDVNTVASLALRVDLVAGANAITFSNRIERAPDIDRIIISN